MATSAPKTTIQMGRLLGRFNPNSRPVMMAEPSVSVGLRLSMYLAIAHSKNIHANTLLAHTSTLPTPKKRNDTSKVGNNARMTPYMFFSTLSGPWA